MVANDIEQRLREDLSPLHLVLENESHRHNVPANSETHFKLTLVSEQFSGMTRVKRHQLIYGKLQDVLDGPVHALALHLHTPEEWSALGGSVPASPNCRGGSAE
jgi:BolA protein